MKCDPTLNFTALKSLHQHIYLFLIDSSAVIVSVLQHQDNTYSTTDEIQEMRRRTSLEEAQQGSNSGSVPGSNQVCM